jgi:3-hydroxyisobutyrate dehydrogenase
MPKVGFLGLGAMGLGMASHLAMSGFEVTGFDINPEAIKSLVNKGGRKANTPRAAAANANILIVVVGTSDQATFALLDDVSGALKGLLRNGVILLCITAAQEYVTEVQQK